MRWPNLAITIAVTAVTVSCKSSPNDDARLVKLENQLESHGSGVTEVEGRAVRVSAAWEDVRVRYERAAASSAAAREQFDQAANLYATGSAELRKAAQVAERADARWRLYQKLIVIAAAIDAANLDQARAGTQDSSDSIDCEDGMSTAAYRSVLAAQGKLLAGVDVDHIVPKSLGGADHPANYQLLPSATNRSLGNVWNEEKCLAAGEDACARAVATSRTCGKLTGMGF